MSSAVPASALIALPKTREEYLPTGLPLIDEQLIGVPRGAVTEVTGAQSSGKTSLLHSILAQAAGGGECVAVIDTQDAFDPASAARCGADLGRLVWVRCRGDAGIAMRAADLILHGGGFGVVCLDLSGVPPRVLNRIPISWWWRFRRAVEKTPAVFLIVGEQSNARSCASCWLDFRPVKVRWSGKKPYRLLRGLETEVVVRKPAGRGHVCLFTR